MKTAVTLVLVLLIPTASWSQTRYFTKSGTIHFNAGTSVEDIDAINKSATSVMDVSTGQLEFAVLIKGFEFRRGLMQEHFNENYMESSTLPKATFKGRFEDLSVIDFKKDGSYPTQAKGTLEIHGIKKEVTIPGTVKIINGTIHVESTFEVRVTDYQIEIPGPVKDKISPAVQVHVKCEYKSLNP